MTASEKIAKYFNAYKVIGYKSGEMIIRAEEDPVGVNFIDRGFVREFTISKEGEELSLHIFSSGSFFPLTWAIANIPNRHYFAALGETEIRRAGKESFISFINEDVEILYDLSRRLLSGLDGMMTRIESLSFSTVAGKLGSIILLLCKHFGEHNGEEIRIKYKFSQRDLAAFALTTRESVSLELGKWKAKKWITYQGRYLVIKNLTAFQTLMKK